VKARKVLCAQGERVVIADELHEHARDEEDEIFDIGVPVDFGHQFAGLIFWAHLFAGRW